MTTTLPPRTVKSLNKEKTTLLQNPKATPLDFIRLSEEYARLGEDRQVTICEIYSRRLESKADPDEQVRPDDCG